MPDRMILFFPLHSLARHAVRNRFVPITLSSRHFFPLHCVPSFNTVRFFSFFSSFSIRTREGCLHAYKAVGVHALEEKHGRTLLERVLKTAVGEEKEKVAKEGEGCERAGTG